MLRRMSKPGGENDSQMSIEEVHPPYSTTKGIISATCKFNKLRNKSVGRQRGPAIKRNTNFKREIKVVPYNISTIENIITKHCLIEVSDKGIQADGLENEVVDIYSSHFFLTNKDPDNIETLRRRKIPIRAHEEEVDAYSTEENVIMNPIDDMESLYKQKVKQAM